MDEVRRESTGIVHLVGAGPGDPGLLTVRGRELLESCDAIATDALANPSIVAAAQRANPSVEVHDVGKRGGERDSATQDSINELLVRLAREGKRVVRLKGGDPFVFGRGSEEAQALARAGIGFEVVPGVTAGVAAPAYAGIPVTHRAVATAVTFVTGHEDPAKPETQTDWASLARAGGTIVLYMGVKSLPRITAALMAGGMRPDTPAAAVQWGTHPRQRTITATVSSLSQAVTEAKLSAPVITVIGDVVGLRENIGWFERKPLFGTRIVVTRASAQASTLSGMLAALGADVLEMPALRIEPLDDEPLRRALDAIGSYQWLVLTSQNAVERLWSVLIASGRDARSLSGVKVACVGRMTADALRGHGIVADVVPTRFVAEGVLEAMTGRDDVRGTRVLYVAAEGARRVLSDGVRAIGASVDVLAVYRSVPDNIDAVVIRAALERGEVDAVLYASASAVRGFVDAVGLMAARNAPGVSIGPTTSDAVRAAGITLAAESGNASMQALVDTTRDVLQRATHVSPRSSRET